MNFPPLLVPATLVLATGCGSRSALLEPDPGLAPSAGGTTQTGGTSPGGAAGTITTGGSGGTGGTLPVCVFGNQPVTLVDDQNEAYAIAVDDAFVYYTIATDGGALRRVPKHGGATVELLAGLGRPRHIALDANNVYVTSPMDGRVLEVKKDGSSAIELVHSPPHPEGIAMGTSAVFWVRTGPGAKNGALQDWTDKNGSAETLASGLDDPWALAAAGDDLYWIDNSSGATPGIWHYAFPNFGLPEMLTALPASNGNDIVVDETHVYYALNAELDRVPRSGGTAEILSKGIFIWGLALRDHTLYWVEGADPYGGKLTRWSLEGGSPEVLADKQSSPTGIALDEACVYWTNRGGANGIGSVKARAR